MNGGREVSPLKSAYLPSFQKESQSIQPKFGQTVVKLCLSGLCRGKHVTELSEWSYSSRSMKYGYVQALLVAHWTRKTRRKGVKSLK